MVIDISILNLFAQIRTESLVTFFIFIYYFEYVVLSILLILKFLRNKKEFLSIIKFLIIGFLIIYALKYITKVPRPSIAALEKADYSFPSNHMFISFFSILLLPTYKPLRYFIISYLYFLVPFSLIYLGIHYIEDMVVGSVIGLVFVFLFKFFHKRGNSKSKEG